MWNVVGGVLGLIAVAIGLLYAVGRRLSPDHVVTATLQCSRPIEEVHALIRDIARWHTWDSGVTRIEPLEPEAGCDRVRMFMGGNSFVLSVLPHDASSSLTLNAIDDHGFFEGRWVYELSVQGEKTIVRLTEYGRVKPAIPRAIMKYFADPAMYLKRHLTMVAKRFSEPPVITDARRIS
jgi:hypothetical protein